LKVIAVEGVVERVPEGWRTTGNPYVFDQAKWAAIRAARQFEADLMRSYAGGRGCLMEFLQRALDDPDPGPCGRCSVCSGDLPAQGMAIDPESLRAAQIYLRGTDVVIEQRKMWPRGLSDGRKAKIIGASEGRALAFADSPEWREATHALRGPDGILDPEVIDGMVQVLARWKKTWSARPVAVIPMPSRRHPTMVLDLANRIAEVGSLELIDALEVAGPRPPDDTASGPKVEALIEGLTLRPGVSVPSNGPVLLIDDTYRSGWTMTVAASLLRNAGSPQVLPLVVHQMP
ncbi:MAG: ATP-dependent DNA helicase RecQ, partial [Actinomycetes bacterium]